MLEQARLNHATPEQAATICSSHPDDWQLQIRGARLLLEKSHAETALRLTSTALEAEHRWSSIEQAALEGYAAQALLELGRRSEGEARFRRSLQLDKDCIPGFMAEGLWLEDRASWDLAERAFLIVTAADAQNAEAWYHLGMVQSHDEHYPGAIESFNYALQLSPRNSSYLTAMGNVYASQGDYSKAVSYFKLALAANPSDQPASAVLDLAEAFNAHTRDEYLGIRSRLERRFRTGGNVAYNQGVLGMLDLRFGRTREALGELQNAAHGVNPSANVFYNLSLAYQSLGLRAEGNTALAKFQQLQNTGQRIRTLEARLSQQGDDPSLHEELARACETLGQQQRAISEYQRVLHLRPGERFASERLRALQKAMLASASSPQTITEPHPASGAASQ